AAAREVRYAALARLADELGAVAVLLGHTARDQAETVLMRIVRGTGPAGLAGMPARRDCFVRPLLALGRETIDTYVVARGLAVWDDPMNVDPSFARVRMRRELLPALRRENPQLDAALLRLASSAAEWLEVIDAAAAPFATLPIACAALARQPAAIRKRAVCLALEALAIDHDAVHLTAIDELVCAPPHGELSVDLPGARIVRTYDALAVAVTPPRHAPLVPPPGPYAMRLWQPGDRMRPARLKGRSRKLSDLYTDAKIPRAARAQARVVVRTTDATIVWAEHVGIAFGEPASVIPNPV
ncbi:MAG: tRNA lysidine(34) synthetase TilS, partial [Deltaproteobacteria bacterium]|nr:tRNA lysidine(34) synthetase TilS [Deltaproteobacteria bacterium]